MKTIFTQIEIQQALLDYVTKQGIVIDGRNVDVLFNRGRGEGNLTAEVNITDPQNFFANKPVVAVSEEPESVTQAVEDNPPKPVEETPPFTPDEPKETVKEEAQTGNSVPSSDPLPKTLFGPN